MQIDRRYPHIHHVIDAPGLSETARAAAHGFANAVCLRAMCNCGFNTRTGGLFFFWGTLDRPIFEFAFRPKANGLRPVGQNDVEDAVALIQRIGKTTPEEKDRIVAQNDKSDKEAVAQSRRKFLADRRPGVKERLSYRDRERRGTQKVIS